MFHRLSSPAWLAGSVATLALCGAAGAAPVQVTVTVDNLAPANSVSFTPLNLGFHGGSFDAFNLGQVAAAPLVQLAETGDGSAWQAAFAAADPTSTRGSIAGLLLPGQSRSATFIVDVTLNPYFSFAAMVLPSNDFFIGNDSPTRFRLFDAGGQLQIGSIVQTARQIWDAGSEVFDPATAAFVGNAPLRSAQNSVVAFNFAELAAFNGLATGAGYSFNSALSADTEVYRLTFSAAAVPEPETYALMAAGLLAVGWVARRRREPPLVTVHRAA